MSMTETVVVTPSRAGWAMPAVSWSAVFAGAVIALALSAALIILGSAFGFAAFSPFTDQGLSLTTIGIVTILWLIFTQIVASAAGGYLAGRLRIRWSIQPDEVFFRDTAHGFLAWSVATALMFSIAAIAGGVGAHSGAILGAAAIEADGPGANPAALVADRLYRSPGGAIEASSGARDQAERIFALALVDENTVSASDREWLAADVSARLGVNPPEGQARVQTALGEIEGARETARDEADAVRAASATLAIATFLAMLIGAFVACFAAVFGGRERDGLEDRLLHT